MSRVAELEEELAEYKREFAELRSQDLKLKEARRELSTLRVENERLRDASAEAESFAAQEAEFLNLIEEAEKEAMRKSDEADAANSRAYALQTALADAENARSSELETLQDEVDYYKAQFEALKAQPAASSPRPSSFDSLRAAVATLEGENDVLRSQLATAREESFRAKELANAATAEANTTASRLRKEHEASAEALRTRIAALSSRPRAEDFAKLKERLRALELSDAFNDADDSLSETERVLLAKLRKAQSALADSLSAIKLLKETDIPALVKRADEAEARCVAPSGSSSGWLKARVDELEASKESDLRRFQHLDVELARLRSDNVALVEKARYLQSLGAAPRSKDAGGSYASEYERQIDPFQRFRANEKSNRAAKLSAWERFALEAVSSRPTRVMLLVYAIAMHVVAFASIWIHVHFDSPPPMRAQSTRDA